MNRSHRTKTIKEMQERMQHIAEILAFNTKTPDFFKLSSERNALSVQIEIVRQQQAGKWNPIQVVETVSINQHINK